MTTLTQIGPFVQIIGVLLGAIIAILTFLFFHRRSLHIQWITGFRQIYVEFWKDESISRARRRIDNDREYETLRKTVADLLSKKKVDLDEADYALLEDLDKLCALLLQAVYIGKLWTTGPLRSYWASMFESYWLNRMYGRPEIRLYIQTYWPHLYQHTYNDRKIRDLKV